MKEQLLQEEAELPAPSPRASTGWSRKKWGVVGFMAALMIGGVVWMSRPASVPELPRDQLVLKETPGGAALFLAKDPEVLFNGWMTEAYPGGRRKSRSRVVEGKLHGLSEGWHAEGGLAIKENFREGVAEGAVLKWHADGTTLRSEGTARAGKLEGVFRRWHPNGVLAEEIAMRGGLPHGRASAWDETGALLKKVMMEAGQPAEVPQIKH